jgi:hypothetical protein
LQGTFVAGRLELEEVDSRHGRDQTFYGLYSEADGTLRGTWESRVFGTGQPSFGSWSARKRADAEAEEAEPAEAGGQAEGG